MSKALKEHIDYINNILENETGSYDWTALSDYNKTRIGFFQHERMVHLLITLFWGLIFLCFTITSLLLSGCGNYSLLLNIAVLVINIVSFILLVFYILHYYFLENGIQKLYGLENDIEKHRQKDYPQTNRT